MTLDIEIGDCREIMRRWIAEGVKAQTCVTSPPYWGLRDYGVEGQLGLEATPEEYVANMVEVFRLVREVLADDGTLWLNMGDSYSGNASSGGINGNDGGHAFRVAGVPVKRGNGLKPKDLVGIPWRLAFALQADGWYLRSDIIWSKPNPMPESVTDRPTKAHEYLFLLAKRERYYYDGQAISEAGEWCGLQLGIVRGRKVRAEAMGREPSGNELRGADANAPPRRNRRTVWTIATRPYSEAHFATFPEALVEPCILAGTSTEGHCPACGNGWVRRIELGEVQSTGGSVNNRRNGHTDFGGSDMNCGTFTQRAHITKGWLPSCACGLDPVPGIVLDPFIGSGTVAKVAQRLGRRWLGCELNPQYARLQEERTRGTIGMQL